MARAIAFALRQSETGTRVEKICRQMGVSQATARAASAVRLDKQMLQDVIKKQGRLSGCEASLQERND